MLESWTLFDKTMLFLAVVSGILTTWIYFYTHPRKKQ